MSRQLVYTKKVRAKVTDEVHRAVEREAALTGTTCSEVLRTALRRYFATPEQVRRAR